MTLAYMSLNPSAGRFNFCRAVACFCYRVYGLLLLIIIVLSIQVPQLFAAQWQPIGPRAATAFTMARNPFNPAEVYIGTHFGGLYFSEDGGLSWSHVDSPFSNRVVFTIAMDPQNFGTLYAGTFQHGIYKSTDSGSSWVTANEGLEDLSILDLKINPHRSSNLLAATLQGVFITEDGGLSWNLTIADEVPLYAQSLLFDQVFSDVVYLGTNGLGLYRSLDSGQNWLKLDTPLTGQVIHSLDLDEENPWQLYVSSSEGVFETNPLTLINSDGLWNNLSLNLADTPVFQVHARIQDEALLAATDQAVYIHQADNDSWEEWINMPSRILFSDRQNALFHVAGAQDIVQVTADDGLTFFPADEGIQNRFVGALEAIYSNEKTVIYAGTDKGVEFTSLSFAESEILEGPDIINKRTDFPWALGRSFDGAIFDITAHASQEEILFAGSERLGVWKTDNFGEDWFESSTGMVPQIINQLHHSKAGDHVFYAGTVAGIYISRDNGNTWQTDSNTATPTHVSTIDSHPESTELILYGTKEGKIYRSIDEGEKFQLSWQGIGIGIRQIEIAPFFNIYAVMDDGSLLSSTDDGLNFFALGEGQINKPVLQVAADPERPWIAYAATVGGGIYKTDTRGLQWQAVNQGISNQIIFSLILDENNPEIIYAGSVDGLFKSSNAGQSWQLLNNGLPQGFVTHLALSPYDSNRLLAVFDESAVYQSGDGGLSWSLLYQDNNNGVAFPVSFSETDSETLLAGSYGYGVFRSDNGGNSWLPASQGMTLFVRTVAVDTLQTDTIYAGSLSSGVFKSVNSGETWSPMGLTDRNIFKLQPDTRQADTVYAGTSLGISKSIDGGRSWKHLGQQTDFAYRLVIDPHNSQLQYLPGVSGKLFKSIDAGESWQLINKGLPATNIIAMVIDVNTDTLYISAERAGIYKSSDQGVSWQLAGQHAILNSDQVTSLVMDNEHRLLAGTQKNGVFRSWDGGNTWEELALPLDSLHISSISISPHDSSLLFISTLSSDVDNHSLITSTDTGINWQTIEGVDTSSITQIAFTASAGLIYASSEDALFRSVDRGSSWQKVMQGPKGIYVSALKVNPENDQHIFAGTAAQGLYQSFDGGLTWQLAKDISAYISHIRVGSNDQIVVSTLGSGLFTSFDMGVSWDDGADIDLLHSSVLAIGIDSQDSNIIYAGTGGTGVHKSVDGGGHWTAVNNGLDDLSLLAMLIDPSHSERLYVATAQGGVFVSIDGAASWQTMNEGLYNKAVTSLSFDKNDSHILFAGTEGGGVFRIINE